MSEHRDAWREWADANRIRVSGDGLISAQTTFGPIEVGAQATWNVLTLVTRVDGQISLISLRTDR